MIFNFNPLLSSKLFIFNIEKNLLQLAPPLQNRIMLIAGVVFGLLTSYIVYCFYKNKPKYHRAYPSTTFTNHSSNNPLSLTSCEQQKLIQQPLQSQHWGKIILDKSHLNIMRYCNKFVQEKHWDNAISFCNMTLVNFRYNYPKDRKTLEIISLALERLLAAKKGIQLEEHDILLQTIP